MKFFVKFKNESGEHELAIKAENKEEAKIKFGQITKKSKSNNIILEVISKEEKESLIKKMKANRSYYSSSACHIQSNRSGKKNTRAYILYG